MSEWILDIGATYHVCPKRELFSSFEKLNGGLTSIGDDHTCCMERISIVHIKIIDEMVRELKDMRYVP